MSSIEIIIKFAKTSIIRLFTIPRRRVCGLQVFLNPWGNTCEAVDF